MLDADWSVPAGDGDWSCRETGVHMADSWFAHATRLVAGPVDDWVAARVDVPEPATAAALLQAVTVCGEILCAVATVADPDAVAWHPWGDSDTAGTIAMGVVEGLVHAYDIASTLGDGWRPPAHLARPALERLFPDAPDPDAPDGPGVDAGDVLLWCTGRIALPGRPRLTTWRWWSAVPG